MEILGDGGPQVTPGAASRLVAGQRQVVVTGQASDVYAPLGGRIVETNQAVVDEPALVNRAAGGEGWFFKMELADPAAFQALMDEDAYTAFVASL